MEQIEYTTQPSDAGRRLDVVLAEKFPNFSRAQWQATLAKEPACINGAQIAANTQLKASQVIRASLPTIRVASPVVVAPTQLPEVLYEDDDVIVINKPAGLLTHPTNHSKTPSVAGAFASQVSDSDPMRPGIVHRLDRDTSGVMILARTKSAKEFLQAQFKNREVAKHYTALVVGKLGPPSARIELPLGRSAKQPNVMTVTKKGRPAISEYTVTGVYPGATLVDVTLLTGRTHQIRAQFAHLGHPVVGDPIYGHMKAPANLGRQFLHSSSLALTLPNKQKKIFQVPLPDDLTGYLEQL